MSAGHPSRSSLPITTKGMGRHFCSPRKPRNKKKTSTTVPIRTHAFKRQRLLDELADLLSPPSPEPGSHIGSATTSPTHHFAELPEPIEPEEELFTLDSEEALSGNATVKQTCTTHPTEKSISLCASWKAVIRTIINPFIKYTTAMLGKPLPILGSPLSSCTALCQEQKLDNDLP
ncbi:hypothetical protein PISMIDRAFT_17742 [Pisolithus microcarpus 441]|uniref:Uncharacterized protein n=1 Tax=Pisolithus microcarpus 441 TaxID=765257 RepID=A0A0C9YJ29_9AGAM|nr:hypothetical protein PISMIDRAFT_17742 [Pisolithus microcarpus 441]